MPEGDAQPQAQPETPGGGGGGGGGLLGGTKGWIILITIVVVEAVIFLLVLRLRPGQPGAVGEIHEEEGVQIPLTEYNKHRIQLENLAYSIRMQGGTTATLSMNLNIVLGRTVEERQRNITISENDWKKFQEAVTAMIPAIRDQLVIYIDNMTFNQLQTPSGKEKIKSFVREFINSELRNLDLDLDNPDLAHDRVLEVQIPMFYLQ
jgi:flagellar basal body-associated protein FliL